MKKWICKLFGHRENYLICVVKKKGYIFCRFCLTWEVEAEEK